MPALSNLVLPLQVTSDLHLPFEMACIASRPFPDPTYACQPIRRLFRSVFSIAQSGQVFLPRANSRSTRVSEVFPKSDTFAAFSGGGPKLLEATHGLAQRRVWASPTAEVKASQNALLLCQAAHLHRSLEDISGRIGPN